MRIKIVPLISAVILFSNIAAIANSENKTSIALITDKASSLDKSPLVSLLEAELSQKEGIRLLERAAIDKILDEQKLSAAGLLDRNVAIKIGKLLRADAFIILSLENQTKDTNDLIRIRVSETAHGLRLLDYFEQADNANPKEAAERITKKLETVLKKINQPDEKLIPIGIVDIHRVQLGEQYKMLERTLPVMLSVRLSLEPQIIMLEREDLKVLLDEKLRTEGEDTKFWNSAILIEGYLQPNNGHLEMHLNLKQAAGEELKSLTILVEPNEPAAAIAKATTEIVQQLQNSPPAILWQPEQEAEKFYIQGQMLSNHQRYDEAIPLFETAHALQPQNVFYTSALFQRIWQIRREIEEGLILIRVSNKILAAKGKSREQNSTEYASLLKKLSDCPYTDIELVDLLSVFVRQIQRDLEKGNLSSRKIHDEFARCLGDRFEGNSAYFSSSVSVNNEQIKQINCENRKIWIETINKTVEQRMSKKEITIENASIIKARLTWISSVDPNELMENLKYSFTEFVMPPELGGKIASAQERDHIFEQAFLSEIQMGSPFNSERTHLKNDNGKFLKLWQEFIRELAESDNAYVSSKGRLAIARGTSTLTDASQKTQATNSSLELVREMADKLTNPDGNLDRKDKQQLITSIRKILLQISSIGRPEERYQIWEDIYEYFIEQKDIDSLIELGISAFKDFRYKQDTIKKSYKLLDRFAEVLKTSSDNKQVNVILAQIKDLQDDTRKNFPSLKLLQSAASLAVTNLLTKNDLLEQGTFYGCVAEVNDENIWIAMFSGSSYSWLEPQSMPSYVDLVCINLKLKKITSLWQITLYSFMFPTIPPGKIPGILITDNFNYTPAVYPRKITGLVVTDQASYVSIQNAGLLEFPGSKEQGFGIFIDSNIIPEGTLEIEKRQKALSRQRGLSRGIIHEKDATRTERKLKLYTQKNNLPSVLLTAIAQDKNKLWIAYGVRQDESGLGLYDPNTESWETLFCSTLKNGSPFSNGQPYEINSMINVYPNILFFNVSTIEQTGLWKVNTATHETKFVQPIFGILNKDFDGNIRLQSSGYLCKIDPLTEKMTLNIRPSLTVIRRYPQNARPLFGLEEDMFLPESFLEKINLGTYRSQGNLDFSTGTIHNNKLWARLGKSQIIIAEKGKSFEEAKIIDNNILDGNPVLQFVSTPYGLIGIGEGVVGLIETENAGK